jgi:predicted PurR-regulated permease PerM
MRAPNRRAHLRPEGAPPVGVRSRVGGWSIAAALAVAAVLLYVIRYGLFPFVFSIAIAFVVDPAVVWLISRARLRRWAAATLVYILVACLLVGAVYWLGVELVSDVKSLSQGGRQIATQLLTRLFGPQGITLFGTTYSPQEVVTAAGREVAGMFSANMLAHVAGAGVTAIFALVLLLVLLPYFMISGPRLVAGAIWLIPPERRHSVKRLLPRLLPVLRRYLVGVFVVVSYASAAAWVGFGLIFGLPHAALLAITVGLLEIIPAIGPVTAAVLGALAAFQHSGSLAGLAGPIVFIVALRLSIDNLVGPLVLGQAARIHPVVVMFAFVSGAMLFGPIGLLLAVPTAVTLKIALQHYYAEPVVEDDASAVKPR